MSKKEIGVKKIESSTEAEIIQKANTNYIPKVSIIMPSLNVINYIEECIESVINQSLKDIEIICVDAGSTDGTYEVLESYAKKDNRISLITSKIKSYGYQMNLGLQNATGEYIGIVETDDYIDLNMYAELYILAKENDVDFIKSDFQRFEDIDSKRKFSYIKLYNNKDYYNKILYQNENHDFFKMYVLTQPGIYKHESIKKNNIRYNQTPGAAHQDNGFYFQICMYSKNAFFLDKAFYYLRRDNPESSMLNVEKNMYAMCEENDFIRGILRANINIEKEFAPISAMRRFQNYSFVLKTLTVKSKLKFLYRFSQDFSVIERRNELDRNHYSDFEWDKLQSIIHDPVAYYERTCKNGIKKSTNFIKRVIYFIKEQGLKNTVKKVLQKIGAKK